MTSATATPNRTISTPELTAYCSHLVSLHLPFRLEVNGYLPRALYHSSCREYGAPSPLSSSEQIPVKHTLRRPRLWYQAPTFCRELNADKAKKPSEVLTTQLSGAMEHAARQQHRLSDTDCAEI